MYGAGNERRSTGAHETAPITSSRLKFSYRDGVAAAEAEGKGYFEDRRPASNMDPYLVTAKVFS